MIAFEMSIPLERVKALFGFSFLSKGHTYTPRASPLTTTQPELSSTATDTERHPPDRDFCSSSPKPLPHSGTRAPRERPPIAPHSGAKRMHTFHDQGASTKRSRLAPNDTTDGTFVQGHDASTTTSSHSAESQISPPEGEPGRPGGKGYNFEKELKWSQADLAALKSFLYPLVDERLDTTQRLGRQDEDVLKGIREDATRNFPVLNRYAGCWPVNDILFARLHYLSRRSRKSSGSKGVTRRVPPGIPRRKVTRTIILDSGGEGSSVAV